VTGCSAGLNDWFTLRAKAATHQDLRWVAVAIAHDPVATLLSLGGRSHAHKAAKTQEIKSDCI
jgi:hypothetical protein